MSEVSEFVMKWPRCGRDDVSWLRLGLTSEESVLPLARTGLASFDQSE